MWASPGLASLTPPVVDIGRHGLPWKELPPGLLSNAWVERDDPGLHIECILTTANKKPETEER